MTRLRDLLTIQELAEEEGIPIATLRWWRATSSAAGPRSGTRGRRVVYKRSDIEAWKESGFSE
jgi:DNA-binding transcriptional MerR regulator